MSEFRLYNIVPYSPGYEEQSAKDAIDLYKKAGICRPLYSLSFHPEGKCAMDKAEILIASYRKFRDVLKVEPGIQCGILIQSIMGHQMGQSSEIEPWQRIITHHGVEGRFCPLDDRFADYIRKVGAMCAAEDPVFILGDDDIRSWGGGGIECFCPLHTAEYNRRFGGSFTPEEYRQAVLASTVNDPVYKNYDTLRREQVIRIASLLREGIDSVNPSIPGGGCMPGGEFYFYQDAAQALAAEGQGRVMRVCNALYVEQSPREFGFNVMKTQAYRKYHHYIPCMLDESDTFPHSLFSKSAISFHAKITSAIFNGLNGCKLWCVNSTKMGGQFISRKYTDILVKYAKFYPALAKEVENTSDAGVRIACFSNSGDWHATNKRDSYIFPNTSWEDFLGICGIPFQSEVNFDEDAVYSLRGADVVKRFTDEELMPMFSKKMLIDGAAAEELTKRGFARYMGVEAIPNHGALIFNGERYLTGPREGNIIYCRTWKDAPLLKAIDSNIRELTGMFFTPFPAAPNCKYVSPGAVVFENSLGGRICTTCFMSTDEFTPRAGEPRRDWLRYLLGEIDPDAVNGSTIVDQPFLSLRRKTADGGSLQMLTNLGFDRLDEVVMLYPGAKEVKMLSADGKWEAVNFTVDGDLITLGIAMPCYETVIIKVK